HLAGRHRSRQPVDAAHASGGRRALVRSAEPPVLFPRAGPCPRDELGDSSRFAAGAARRSLPSFSSAPVLRLQRSRDQPLAQHHSAGDLPPRGGGAGTKHGLHARGRPVHHPDHPGLYRMVIPRVPRQGEGRRRLSSLMASATDTRNKWLRRAGWLVLIWTASVAATGLAAFFFRLVMQASGLTL